MVMYEKINKSLGLSHSIVLASRGFLSLPRFSELDSEISEAATPRFECVFESRHAVESVYGFGDSTV